MNLVTKLHTRPNSCFTQVVLSSVSPFFKTLLLENPCSHPIVILPSGIDPRDLETIVEFVYGGEVEVPEARLDSVLRAAQQLQIEGMLQPRGDGGDGGGGDRGLDMEVEAALRDRRLSSSSAGRKKRKSSSPKHR